MMNLDSVVVILMIEGLVALILILAGLWIWSAKKKSEQFKVAHSLIEDLNEDKPYRTEKLGQLIADSCSLDPSAMQMLLKNIDTSEKALYQQIIQVFLNRDPKVLKGLEEYIQDLSKPYCAMLKHAEENAANPAMSAELEGAQQEISRLRNKIQALEDKLQLALSTVDEVSDEYAQMFHGSKGEQELRAGYKRFMHIFQTIEDDLNNAPVKL